MFGSGNVTQPPASSQSTPIDRITIWGNIALGQCPAPTLADTMFHTRLKRQLCAQHGVDPDYLNSRSNLVREYFMQPAVATATVCNGSHFRSAAQRASNFPMIPGSNNREYSERRWWLGIKDHVATFASLHDVEVVVAFHRRGQPLSVLETWASDKLSLSPGFLAMETAIQAAIQQATPQNNPPPYHHAIEQDGPPHLPATVPRAPLCPIRSSSRITDPALIPQAPLAHNEQPELNNLLDALIYMLAEIGISSRLCKELVKAFCLEPADYDNMLLAVRALLDPSNTKRFMEFTHQCDAAVPLFSAPPQSEHWSQFKQFYDGQCPSSCKIDGLLGCGNIDIASILPVVPVALNDVSSLSIIMPPKRPHFVTTMGQRLEIHSSRNKRKKISNLTDSTDLPTIVEYIESLKAPKQLPDPIHPAPALVPDPTVALAELAESLPKVECALLESEESTVVNITKTKMQHDILDEWRGKEQAYLDVLYDYEGFNGTQSCVCNQQLILKWTGSFFEGASCASLGLELSIPHRDGTPCCRQKRRPNFTVIHSNGFHQLCVNQCICPGSLSFDLQLLQLRLFPASVQSPRTAFTFEALNYFRIIHLEGQISSHAFTQALERLTGDEYKGAWEVKDRAREFQRVARQWNYVLERKKSQCMDVNSLASPCPACPHPGKNIPLKEEGDGTLDDERTMGMHKDPGLWKEDGFFVENKRYQAYCGLLPSAKSQQSASTCTNLRALLLPRSRFARLNVTGVAGAVCRHECAIPGSFVDMFQGESAFNRMQNLNEFVVSYDIACQFSKNFQKRVANNPEFLFLPDCDICFAIPKFHCPAHKDSCRVKFSLNYLKGVGRTDGEAIERLWATLNHLSS
ncbi:606_t:CDS:10, partial [Acaulospora colombiana]